jgi:hypothetical protein
MIFICETAAAIMKHKWQKLGLLYCPSGVNCHPKLISHAANPLPILLGGDVYRIFFSGRDAGNKSSVGAVDIDIVERKIVREHHDPFFEAGPPGSFYAEGVSIGCCYEVDNIQYMLFMGWFSPKDSHWRGELGRLVVRGDCTLELDKSVPFLSLNAEDPISLSYPWVLSEPEGFKMWYGSTLSWEAGNGEMLHVINHASSVDGHTWHRKGLSVPYILGPAQAFSRPTVIREHSSSGYEMWFSYRGVGTKYRIGYASSETGESWELKLDQVGIDVSAEGWDSDMIEYPFVFNHRGLRYMLYAGNDYGKTGFGLAIWE